MEFVVDLCEIGMGNSQANLKRKSENIRDVLKTIHFDDEVIEIVDSYPAFKKPRLPIQGEQEVIDLTNLLIETPSVLDDGEIEKNLASQSLKSTGCINSTDQLQATTQAYSCAASTSSFQQLLLNESVESLMEKIKRIVSQADPTLKTEKILRGLQNSFNKLKKDYRDSKDFHKMLLDVKADMEKKDVFGCLKALFTELKLHRDENIEGEAKTDDPQLRLKKSLIKNAQKVIKNEKNLIEKWEKCEKIRSEMTPSEIEDLPIFFEQFETGLAEFDLYLLKKIENGKQISSEKILKKLKSLNQNLAYNLDKDEVMEICKIVFKKFSDHEKLIRTKIYEIHRKQETNIAFEDPAEQDEDLEKKLAENAIKNAENEKKRQQQRLLEKTHKLDALKRMAVKTATLVQTEDVTPESKKLDKPNNSTPQQATDISLRFADPEQIEPGISDSVTDQPVSKPAEEVQNEQVNITEKERSTY